jgi:DNA processing protein
MSELATARSTDELQVAYYFWLSQMTYLSESSALKFRAKFPTFESWDSISPSERNDAAKTTLGEKDSSKVLPLNFYAQMDKAFKDLKSHRSRGIRVLSITDPIYPDLLKKIPDPPIVLFVRGAIEALIENKNVAVIGTRDTTPTGEKVATRIAKWLGEHSWCIVSGLAKGIDAAAHRGALEAKAKTIAVMATPLDKVYPAENRDLADEILEGNGCWVSEMALWRKPHRGSFVQRDRIQSGLSVAVIPVQTDVKGGTMHTVGYAEKQKRLLLCPRPIDQESSLKQYAGIKWLIETKKAKSFSSDQYPEVLDMLTNSFEAYDISGFKVVITHPDEDHPPQVSIAGDISEEKPRKQKKTKNAASGKIQGNFDFLIDSSNGTVAKKQKKKSKTLVANEIETYEQLLFEIKRYSNPDGSDLSVADVEAIIQSKLYALKQK